MKIREIVTENAKTFVREFPITNVLTIKLHASLNIDKGSGFWGKIIGRMDTSTIIASFLGPIEDQDEQKIYDVLDKNLVPLISWAENQGYPANKVLVFLPNLNTTKSVVPQKVLEKIKTLIPDDFQEQARYDAREDKFGRTVIVLTPAQRN
jgi:hypothetical protein